MKVKINKAEKVNGWLLELTNKKKTQKWTTKRRMEKIMYKHNPNTYKIGNNVQYP